MWAETSSPKLIMKKPKQTAPTTTHVEIGGTKLIVTTHAPASTPIVSLNIEKEGASTSNTNKKSWTETMKNTLPEVKTPEARKESKRKEKVKVSMNTEIVKKPLASNAN